MTRPKTPFRAYAHALALVGVAFVVGSCASSKLEYVESGFSETGVKGRKIAAAAVVDLVGAGVSKNDADTIASQLTGHLRNKRRKADVESLWKISLSKSSPSAGSLKSSVRGNASGIRYAMVIEITGNQISERVRCSESENTETIYDDEGNACGTRVVSVDYTTSSITTRKMQACYKLYDLEKGKTIWVTSTSHSESNTQSRSSTFDHPPPLPFPPPPVLVDVTDNMSRAAIRKLPRK